MSDTMSAGALEEKLREIDDTPTFEVQFNGNNFLAFNEFNRRIRGVIDPTDGAKNFATFSQVANMLRWPPPAAAEVKNRPFVGPPVTEREKFVAKVAKLKRLGREDDRTTLATQNQELFTLPSDVTYEPQWLSPAQCEEFLLTFGGVRVDGKPVQRGLSEVTVKKYANLMLQGAWRLSPDPLAFNKDGRGINGQHRAAAGVYTGMTLPFMVSRGWDNDTFLTLDKNLKRTSTTSLLLEGEAHPQPMATAASTLIRSEVVPYVPDWKAKTFRPDEAAILAAVASRPLLRDAVAWARIGRPSYMNFNALAVARALAAEASGKSFDATAEYFDSLKSGGGLNSGDPALAMRQFMETSKNGDYTRKSERLDTAGLQTFLMLTGWNLTVMRTKLTRPNYKISEMTIPRALGRI